MASEAIVSALAALGGAVVGAGASVLNTSRTAARERARQLSLDRRRYLEPLRLAASDLGLLLMHIDEALAAPATEQAGAAASDQPRLRHLRRPTFSPERRKHETEMLKTVFGKLKQGRGAQGEFMAWANGEGTFAVATLYRTVVYCWAAQRIKQDLPILESRTGDDGQLLELLNEVRRAFGDRWGIWEAIQDSIGSHAALPDGRVISYPEFCGQLSDPNDYIWFLRLIDFYNDVCNGEKAPTRHHPVIRRGIEALDNLLVAVDAGRVLSLIHI